MHADIIKNEALIKDLAKQNEKSVGIQELLKYISEHTH